MWVVWMGMLGVCLAGVVNIFSRPKNFKPANMRLGLSKKDEAQADDCIVVSVIAPKGVEVSPLKLLLERKEVARGVDESGFETVYYQYMVELPTDCMVTTRVWGKKGPNLVAAIREKAVRSHRLAIERGRMQYNQRMLRSTLDASGCSIEAFAQYVREADSALWYNMGCAQQKSWEFPLRHVFVRWLLRENPALLARLEAQQRDETTYTGMVAMYGPPWMRELNQLQSLAREDHRQKNVAAKLESDMRLAARYDESKLRANLAALVVGGDPKLTPELVEEVVRSVTTVGRMPRDIGQRLGKKAGEVARAISGAFTA